jgi:hypothetical protein
MSLDLWLENYDLFKKYKGWDRAKPQAYRNIGINNDIEAISRIQYLLVTIIPYRYIAEGAVKGGHLDMFLYAFDQDPHIDIDRMMEVAVESKQQSIIDYLAHLM